MLTKSLVLNFTPLFTIKFSDMESLAQKLQQLNELVASYDDDKAFDLFYDESLLDYENEDQSAGSLQKHKADMQHFLSAFPTKPPQLPAHQ